MRVNILLSTFNGERYLNELLGSLEGQTYGNIRIIIRDDGSTDGTKCLLSEFAKLNNNVELSFGENIGVVKSFYSLLQQSDFTEELYAFCDQDDIWANDKVERAVAVLSKNRKESVLYCSCLEYVDETLQHIKFGKVPDQLNFNNSILENVAIGCTLMFDYQLREEFLKASPDDMLMHDWWIYLLANAYGHLIFDKYYGVLYRQHDTSVTPKESEKLNKVEKFKELLYVLKSKKFTGTLDWLKQTEVFVETYPLVTGKDKLVVKKIKYLIESGSLFDRLVFFAFPFIRSNSRYRDYVFRLKILFGCGFNAKS